MANLSKAREHLALQILNDFKGKITGNYSSVCVGENPENKYFVGKLLPVDRQSVSFGSDVFIESVNVDFYIAKENIETAKLTVFPKGDFYYRAYPTLEQQRMAFLSEVNDTSNVTYDSFESLVNAYNENPSAFSKTKIKLIPVYKKIEIHKSNFSLNFNLADIINFETNHGFVDATHPENIALDNMIQELQNEIVKDKYCYLLEIYEQTLITDLLSEEAYWNFLTKKAKKETPINQNWNIYVDLNVRLIKNRYFVSIALVNCSQVQSNVISHKSNKQATDKHTIETLFNSGLDIKLSGSEFDKIEMDFFADDYKYDSSQRAVGTNCSVVFDEATNTVSTDHLPTFTQKRLLTNDKLAVSFKDLVEKPIETLEGVHREMLKGLDEWKKYRDNKLPTITPKAQETLKKEVKDFEQEIKRFAFGISILKNYPMILKSFVLMNKTFLATAKKYTTWRLFQIVFIVSMIPDIAACDKDLLLDEEKFDTTLEKVSLLYFPTGGGKTEAFLGVLVFNLFFDRFRGKDCGVTSILRYPLRLLSVQQVQRVANALAQAELLRRAEASIAHTEPFSLGYFVGDGNTPNKIEKKDVLKYRNRGQAECDEERIIDICPFCGKQSVHLKFDEESYRLAHFCDNSDCPSGGYLPIYMVDQEIYRFLPSAIISTVDKLAILGNNTNFRNILSGATHKCPKHGYTSTRKCLVDKEFCKEEVSNFEEVEMYDPAPTLFIQDELHLIRESLGTYASHYESFVDYFVRNESPSKRPIKVIGATATISSYETQITQLYSKDPLRFPCQSPFLNKNFYSYIDEDDSQRFIIGYAPYGKAIINSVVYSLKYMREVVHYYLVNPEKILEIEGIGLDNVDDAIEILKDYWIFLEYNNVKRDGNNVEGALETPINVELKKEGITEFNPRKMTGDETFQDVREVLAQVENNQNVFDGVNLIAATSMISHGVDADRFNIMFFYGIPGNTAEYIQAYSRTGRKHSSIVVDIIRPSRETDQSYLKNFIKFHEFKDIMVESVPINRWATKAIDSTLPGILVGLMFAKYDPIAQYGNGTLFFMKNIRKALINGLLCKETIINELKNAYGCVINGAVNEIGNQYNLKIEEFVSDIFDKITDKDWDKETIFDGFNLIGYHIMNSLRDTDAQLIVELE